MGAARLCACPPRFDLILQRSSSAKDPLTGDVILSRRPHDWDGFLVAAQAIEDADDFLSPAERLAAGHTQAPERDPLDATSNPIGH